MPGDHLRALTDAQHRYPGPQCRADPPVFFVQKRVFFRIVGVVHAAIDDRAQHVIGHITQHITLKRAAGVRDQPVVADPLHNPVIFRPVAMTYQYHTLAHPSPLKEIAKQRP